MSPLLLQLQESNAGFSWPYLWLSGPLEITFEEYGRIIVYIKGIHNTVADAISRLDYGPVPEDRSTMMTFAQCWCHYTSGQEESTSSSASTKESINLVFANQDDEEAIYPLTTREIAEVQKHDNELNNMTDEHGYITKLVENTKVLCKDGKG